MAVEAVADVVIQKLTDMLNEESIIGQEVIVNQLKEIGESLERMSGYFIDAENKQSNDVTIKNWADQYLRNVYDVEDAIETFAFRIARQRKRLGFLMNHALFLKNFTACKKLNLKMMTIRKNIEDLNRKMPKGVEDASVNSRPPLLNGNDQGPVADRGKGVAEEEEEDRGEDADNDISAGGGEEMKDMHNKVENSKSPRWDLKKDALQKPYTSAIKQELIPISPIHETPMRCMSAISLISERLWKTRLMSSYSYDDDELEIVGFKDELLDLRHLLTKEVHGARQIISIFGEMGSGKTTLTQAVMATKRTKDSFGSCCARVNISKESTSEEILLKLLKQVGDSTDQVGLVPELKKRLAERLNEKKYLIVLDNVWNSDMWERLSGAFPDNRYGSKIIITTCYENVAGCGQERLRLNRLNAQDSWDLFLRKAAMVKDDVKDELKQVILEICDGLPLKIVLLGSLLYTKKRDEWSLIIHSRQNWDTSDILALSYNDLSSHLKLCMLYMVVFPKEYDISVRRLLRLWLAEGFIKKPVKEGTFPEDVAQQHFDELFERSLIQISKQKSDGNHRKKCHLIGVLHDYLSPKAHDISLFHVTGEPAPSSGARRLVEYVDSKHTTNPSELKYARSYLSFNFQKKDIPATGVGILLGKMISNRFSLLRTLDLEDVYKPSLPDNLGDFFNLRYLGLRWTFLDTLPSSVGKLTYLETLDIKHTYIKSLPNSIWKLKHLRNLNLNEMLLDMPLAPPSSLPRLLTLWGLSIDRECEVKHGLNELSQLRELGITFNLRNSEVLVDWVSKLKSLQQLMLRSKNDRVRPSALNLKSLSELVHLSNIDLLGKLPKLPVFPRNIKVLSLAVSQLQEDPMPTLGKLEHLGVLRLLANSYLGKRIECQQGGFKELRVLKLWMLRSLEEWVLDDGAMEKLKELNIRCCPKLKNIPRKILLQRAFKELTLTNMPKTFIEDVEQRKSRHVSLIVKDYKFTPLPWKEGDDSLDGIHYRATDANAC